jgi:hypothetical protein
MWRDRIRQILGVWHGGQEIGSMSVIGIYQQSFLTLAQIIAAATLHPSPTQQVWTLATVHFLRGSTPKSDIGDHNFVSWYRAHDWALRSTESTPYAAIPRALLPLCGTFRLAVRSGPHRNHKHSATILSEAEFLCRGMMSVMGILRQPRTANRIALGQNSIKHMSPKEEIRFKDSKQRDVLAGQWLLAVNLKCVTPGWATQPCSAGP